jgi:Putative peptidoglycan binding domain
MAARGSHGTGESDDDWFADGDASGVLETDPPSAEDDWLVPPPPARERPELPWTRIAVVGGALVAVLIAGLAAGGVFSGSSAPKGITSPSISVTASTAQVQTTSHVALPTTTLQPGATGAQVKALQRALKSLGYPVGKVDGDYGPTTKTAVAAFQHAAGLTSDGVFGPKTLNALIHRAGA